MKCAYCDAPVVFNDGGMKAFDDGELKRLQWFKALCEERIRERHDIPWWLAKEWLDSLPTNANNEHQISELQRWQRIAERYASALQRIQDEVYLRNCDDPSFLSDIADDALHPEDSLPTEGS